VDVVCVLPARGGSKRIPGKNTKDFLGKPLIAHPLESLVGNPSVQRVLVSTDSHEIADLSQSLGSELIFPRPQELSGDLVPTLPVVQHAIRFLGKRVDTNTIVMCVYPAAVLDEETWEELISATADLKNDFLVTVGRMRNYPQRALVPSRSNLGLMKMEHPSFAQTRTQDLSPSFYDAGKVYAARASKWLSSTSILAEPFKYFELPYRLAQDLDSQEDWTIAESIQREIH
jgi:N-acylneuraminate cytidylyltransferase